MIPQFKAHAEKVFAEIVLASIKHQVLSALGPGPDMDAASAMVDIRVPWFIARLVVLVDLSPESRVGDVVGEAIRTFAAAIVKDVRK